MAGIASDFTGMMQTVAAFGPAKFAAAAATPIINGGLIMLTVASNTLGFGRPEDGERFGRGAKDFGDVFLNLYGSIPPPDWEGEASDASPMKSRMSLDMGAADYRRTDRSEQGSLDGQMHPR